MTERHSNDVLGWIKKFQNVELTDENGLADIEASAARVCGLSEYVIRNMEFGSEPSGYLTVLEPSDGRGEDNER
ncbi:MAG: hypothetical protein ISR47_02940 [Rhodospirillales bacterium]|nr:hypothetical protein [Rhodospirillales bacterium]